MTSLVPSNGRLDDIARGIKADQARGRAAFTDALEANLSIGHQLRAAKKLLPDKQEFGRWFRAQHFGFTTQWARTLRTAAENEPEVRAEIESQLSHGSANLEKAVKQVVPPEPKPAPVVEVEPAPSAPVIKPPPPDPVQGPTDHTYDVDRFVEDGLVCLPDCPHPDHETEPGADAPAEDVGEGVPVAAAGVPGADGPEVAAEVATTEGESPSPDGVPSVELPEPPEVAPDVALTASGVPAPDSPSEPSLLGAVAGMADSTPAIPASNDDPTCACCGHRYEPRGEDDPWAGHLDGYCDECASMRCDAAGAHPIKVDLADWAVATDQARTDRGPFNDEQWSVTVAGSGREAFDLLLAFVRESPNAYYATWLGDFQAIADAAAGTEAAVEIVGEGEAPVREDGGGVVPGQPAPSPDEPVIVLGEHAENWAVDAIRFDGAKGADGVEGNGAGPDGTPGAPPLLPSRYDEMTAQEIIAEIEFISSSDELTGQVYWYESEHEGRVEILNACHELLYIQPGDTVHSDGSITRAEAVDA